MKPPPSHRLGRRRLLAALLAAALPARAGPAAGASANLASRQPMLAERIAKLHAQIGLDILAGRSPRALAEAVREFEAGMRQLAAGASSPEARESYLLLGLLWDEYRALALRKPTLENAKKLAERSEEIVWVASKAARLGATPGEARATSLVRTAGDVRVLSQRIAKLHLYRHWGVRAAPADAELKAADNEYQLAMAILRAAPQNTPEIASEIVLADNQYLFLGQAVARLRSGGQARQELEFVAKTCDNILEVMERVARLHASANR